MFRDLGLRLCIDCLFSTLDHGSATCFRDRPFIWLDTNEEIQQQSSIARVAPTQHPNSGNMIWPFWLQPAGADTKGDQFEAGIRVLSGKSDVPTQEIQFPFSFPSLLYDP